jgi:hypothetical protein
MSTAHDAMLRAPRPPRDHSPTHSPLAGAPTETDRSIA